MTDPRTVEAVRAAQALRTASIEHDVKQMCSRLDIAYDKHPNLTNTVLPEELRICALLRELCSAFYGMDQRIGMFRNDLLRTSATANSMWNTTNVMWRTLEKRLVERGIFEDRDDFQQAVIVAGEELHAEAMAGISGGRSVDVIQDHIAEMMKRGGSQVAGSVSAAAAERAARDRKRGEEAD